MAPFAFIEIIQNLTTRSFLSAACLSNTSNYEASYETSRQHSIRADS